MRRLVELAQGQLADVIGVRPRPLSSGDSFRRSQSQATKLASLANSPVEIRASIRFQWFFVLSDAPLVLARISLATSYWRLADW